MRFHSISEVQLCTCSKSSQSITHSDNALHCYRKACVFVPSQSDMRFMYPLCDGQEKLNGSEEIKGRHYFKYYDKKDVIWNLEECEKQELDEKQ